MNRDIITDILRKLSYKNISIDTTDGRNVIADELLKYISEEQRKNRYTEPDGMEIGFYELPK